MTSSTSSRSRRTTGRTRRTDRAEAGGSPEEVQARAWLKAHSNDPLVAGASLPSDHRRDPSTGETVELERSFDEMKDRLMSYSKFETVQAWEEARRQRVVRGEKPWSDYLRSEYTPVVGQGGLTPEQLDKRIRMERVFAQLSERDAEALRMHHFEKLSVAECGAEWGVSKSTAQGRIERANQNFLRAFGETWNEGYDLLREVFA